jgi:hypothetical protein
MTVTYHVYANDGLGGPVDYSTPIGTTAGLEFATDPIPPGSDFTFAVRAEDNGLEEANVDCRVRIVTDSVGADVSGRPKAPVALTVERRAGGDIRVRWLAPPSGPSPTGYRVYVGTPSIGYASPAADVATTSADLTGLSDGVTYEIGVRAYNAAAEEPNATTVLVTADAMPPSAVDSLTILATSGE